MQSIFSPSVMARKLPARRLPPAAPQRSDRPRGGSAAPRPATVTSPAIRQGADADAEPPAAKTKKWHDIYKRVRDMLAARYPTIFGFARPLKSTAIYALRSLKMS